MAKLDENECLRLWLAGLRSDKSTRYLKNERKKHIAVLMELFMANGIEQDDAQFMKRKVVEYLVTAEGIKGTKAEHKNWKENAENDYDDAIQITYVQPHVAASIKPMKTAHGYDPRIVSWAKKKFGETVGEEMVRAAHQPMHTLWIMFMNDHHNLYPGEST